MHPCHVHVPLRRFGDWIQGGFQYALYAEYGYSMRQISLIFVVGYACAATVGTYVSALGDSGGHRRNVMAYGVLYSLLYVGTGHRLLAPACCHAGLNVGLSLRDWKRMRATDASKLKRVFAAGQGRDTFGLD